MAHRYRHIAVQAHLGLVRFRLINLGIGVLLLSLLPLLLHWLGVR